MITIGINASGWTKAARELQETSSRSCVDFTNGQALRVSIESVRQTEKGNANEIARTLGATSRGVSFKTISRGKNAGKVKTVRGGWQVKEDSFAQRILLARKKQTGDFGVNGGTMMEMVAGLIRARMAAVSFIAAGWIPARNKLFSVVKNKAGIASSVAGVRKRGQDKGSAKPAAFSVRSKIQAVIENTALLQKANSPAPGGDPLPIASRGLQKALDVTARDMIQTLEKRLNPEFQKFNG